MYHISVRKQIKQNHIHNLSKSNIVSTTCRKAKVEPQPSAKRDLDMFLHTEKGISASPVRDGSGSQNSLDLAAFPASRYDLEF